MRRHTITCLLAVLLLSACTALVPHTVQPGADEATPTPQLRASDSTGPTPIVPPFSFGSDWTLSSAGIELRRLSGPTDGSAAGVLVVRIDPGLVTFRVAYDLAQPRSISRWAADYDALLAVNAGYFDEVGRPVALLISDGRRSSSSYVDQGAMFAVNLDGSVELRALSEQPYADEPFAQALQGWPLLVRAAGVAAYDSEDGQRSRRTAIGVDDRGRVLLAVAPAADFSLAEWSQFLAVSDLGLVRAVNLDGGSSTGLALRSTRGSSAVESFVALPFVLLVTAR